MKKRRFIPPASKPLILVLLLGSTVLSACSEPTDGQTDALDTSNTENGSSSENYTEGYLLTVDGKELAYIDDAETVNAITDHLVNKYKDLLSEKGKNAENIEILSSFELTLTVCPENRITDTDGAIELLNANGIKITYGVTESEIKPIAYETVYQNSSSYYEGVKKVQTSGKDGEQKLTYKVTYSGETETERRLTEEKTVTAPVNQVILVGTKKSTASTGSYAWPTKNVYITSYYGWRTVFGNREYHYGIDLRAAVGTSIYAADGGEVIFVGTQNGYGKLIQIRHDNGDLTYYAHLNSFSVKKGDRVYKGQLIAKSGQTGRVTGPHLHFEIRKNGVRVDPTKYLK